MFLFMLYVLCSRCVCLCEVCTVCVSICVCGVCVCVDMCVLRVKHACACGEDIGVGKIGFDSWPMLVVCVPRILNHGDS